MFMWANYVYVSKLKKEAKNKKPIEMKWSETNRNNPYKSPAPEKFVGAALSENRYVFSLAYRINNLQKPK
jgi:hypothetical protein